MYLHSVQNTSSLLGVTELFAKKKNEDPIFIESDY